jgi:hypothetical protein
VKASEIVPHELNPRTHTDAQRSALKALLDEIGFARSLLAYELPDGRLKLIDGHLRQSMTPDEEVDVEVLDVNDSEARALLLAIDPLAQMAGYDAETLATLREITERDSEAVKGLWHALSTANAIVEAKAKHPPRMEENFLIVVECKDEKEQVKLLRKFKQDGLTCEAKIS